MAELLADLSNWDTYRKGFYSFIFFLFGCLLILWSYYITNVIKTKRVAYLNVCLLVGWFVGLFVSYRLYRLDILQWAFTGSCFSLFNPYMLGNHKMLLIYFVYSDIRNYISKALLYRRQKRNKKLGKNKELSVMQKKKAKKRD